MTGQMFFPEREMTVCFNGTQMATLQSYQVTCTADCEAVCGFGDGAPSGVARGGKRFALTLRRIYPILSGLQDGISLYDLQNFTDEFRIKSTGWLIKVDDFRVQGQCSGDGNSLLLTTR